MSELIQFCKDVSTSFTKLSLPTRAIIGTILSAIVLKKFTFQILVQLVKLVPRKKESTNTKFKQDVVYLHMFPRNISKMVPNLSPYAIKLETWLRLKGIKYEVLPSFPKAGRQIPYIIYNGNEYRDSNFIIEFLSKELNFDSMDGLTDEQKAIERAFISMLDEKTSFTYFLYRYVYEFPSFQRFFQSRSSFLFKMILRQFFPRMFLIRAEAQGIGRKPRSSVIEIGNEDIRAVSMYLGNKKFMMGDRITLVDCCVFGHLSQIVYVDLPYPFTQFIQDQCPNLLLYLETVKSLLWPDWDEIVDKSTF